MAFAANEICNDAKLAVSRALGQFAEMPPTLSAPAPSRRRYLAAAAILIATVVSFGAFLTWRLSDLGNRMIRLQAPGQTDLQLSAGGHMIFQETAVSRDGVVQSSSASGLRLEVSPPGGGIAVTLSPNTGSRYSLGDRSGTSLFDFTIPQPGLYRVTAAYTDGRTAPQVQLAISPGFVGELFQTILIGVGLMFLGIGSAIVLAIHTFIKRRKAARESRPSTV